jgi:hypothetical protein
MPRCIAGTVTLRSEFAERGLFLLSGTLIDPGYEGRLHFFLANLGREPIVLKPEVDAIAAVQFLIVAGEVDRDRTPDDDGDKPAPEAKLGFIENLQFLQASHRDLKRDVVRTRGLTNGLIVVGYFVLGTAVIGTSLATILSITSDKQLVEDVRNAVPRQDSGKWLLAVIVASLALVIYSAAVVLGPGSSLEREDAFGYDDPRDVVLRRWRSQTQAKILTVLIAAIAGAVAIGELIDSVDAELAFWPLWLSLYAGLAILTIYLIQRFRKPLTYPEIKHRTSELAADDKSTKRCS